MKNNPHTIRGVISEYIFEILRLECEVARLKEENRRLKISHKCACQNKLKKIKKI